MLLKNRKNICLKIQREQLKQLLELNEVINITNDFQEATQTHRASA